MKPALAPTSHMTFAVVPRADLWRYSKIALATAVFTAFLFNMAPPLDIGIAEIFEDNGRFFMNDSWWLELIRSVLLSGFTIYYIALVIGLLLALDRQAFLGLSQKAWVFLVACAALGPGLLVNGLLKRVWGRARPRDVEELGGNLDFTTVLEWSSECAANCSFVSGEVSSMAMIFFSLALVLTRFRSLILRTGVIATGLVAMMRLMQGGHFLTDGIFAGVLMMLLATSLYTYIFHTDHFRKLTG